MSVAYVIIFTIAIVLLNYLPRNRRYTCRCAIRQAQVVTAAPPGNTMPVMFPLLHAWKYRPALSAIARVFRRFTAASIGILSLRRPLTVVKRMLMAA